MSGKPKMSWGGRREGSGRPAFMVPANRVKSMLRKMRKAKRELGIDEDDFLVKVITEGKTPEGAEVTTKDRIVCVRIWKEFSTTKTSEQHISVQKDEGMRIAVRLPPKKEDPALKIVGGQK